MAEHRWLVAPGWDRRDEEDVDGWLWFVYDENWQHVAKGVAPTIDEATALARAGI